MKVSLVYPPFLNSIQTTLPEFVDENEGFFHPLGILYLASYLKRYNRDCEVQVIDAVAEKLTYEQIAERLAEFTPDLVGISCWTFSLIDSLKVAELVKESIPAALVCLGGPHVTIYPVETVSFDRVDFAITGDGEKPFSELVLRLSHGGDLGDVPNIYYKRNSQVEKGKFSYTETHLDDLPFPDRTLVPLKNYFSIIDKDKPITTMITSRGCPFKCKFCFQQGTGWRYRNIPSIIAEIEHCVSLGIKIFFIFDETFTVNKERVIKLCDEIKSRKLDISWSCRSRVDTIDEEMMDNLKGAGCNRISFGVESANAEVLRLLNKKIRISRVKEVFKLAKKKRLVTLADFMIGCPGENKAVTLETIKLALDLDPDYVQFTLLTLFPATELYEEALKKGIVKNDVWLSYARNPTVAFKPPIWNVYPEEEARRLLAFSYRRFYLRLSYIFKRMAHLGSFREFKRYTKAGFCLIGYLFRIPANR